MAKRLGELDHNYFAAKESIHNAARELNAHVSEIRFKKEYLKGIEW